MVDNAGHSSGASEGSNPSPSTNVVDCSHLWILDHHMIVRGMVVTGREVVDLPWRRKKDNELASQSEIAREIALVLALEIRGKIQTPKDFESTKLYIREDIK